MLSWLMSWCVPNRALRFYGDFDNLETDRSDPGDRDVQGGRNLRVALASHGVGVTEPDSTSRPRG